MVYRCLIFGAFLRALKISSQAAPEIIPILPYYAGKKYQTVRRSPVIPAGILFQACYNLCLNFERAGNSRQIPVCRRLQTKIEEYRLTNVWAGRKIQPILTVTQPKQLYEHEANGPKKEIEQKT
jgi:hypothetical protein